MPCTAMWKIISRPGNSAPTKGISGCNPEQKFAGAYATSLRLALAEAQRHSRYTNYAARRILIEGFLAMPYARCTDSNGQLHGMWLRENPYPFCRKTLPGKTGTTSEKN